MAEEWYAKADREAAEAVAKLMQRPLPNDRDDIGVDIYFDPWELFPSIYGTYSSEFDEMALSVLCDLRDGVFESRGLAAEIFREMLCVKNLCDYGTSPRVCFPTSNFKPLIPDLITKWSAWYEVQWGEVVRLDGIEEPSTKP